MDRLVWAATDTFDTGGRRLSVRANTEDVRAAVRALLAEQRVDDGDAPVELSIRLEPVVAGVQPLHMLYDDCTAVLRSRDPRRVAGLLVAHVTTATAAVDRRCAVVADHRAVVLPHAARGDVAAIERRLNASGVQLVDEPFAIDDGGAALVVTERRPVDADALAGLDLYGGDEVGPAPAGRYRLVASVDAAGMSRADLQRELVRRLTP